MTAASALDVAMASSSPSWLADEYAPVPDEIDAVDLAVQGALPPELSGRYFRNGPNPPPGEASRHWFTGDGMVHGIRIADGRAQWYRNRWVRTRRLEGHPYFDGTRFDLTSVPANTHVVPHAGKILALVESGFPYVLTPELATEGPDDFDGRLNTPMTAHPKRDPDTGELHFFGYSPMPPFLTYHRLSPSGELVHSRAVQVRDPTMMHDFAITRRHVLWLDLPMTFQRALVASGMPYGWDERYGARIGVMPQDAAGGPRGDGAVQWFEIDPCYVFHTGGAHEDASGRVVLDGMRYTPADIVGMWSAIGSGSGQPGAAAQVPQGDAAKTPTAPGIARLYRWTLDPGTGKVQEEQLDDAGGEFPTLDARRVGREARYRYVAGADGSIVKYDLRTGARTAHALAANVAPGEPFFVPASESGTGAEDEGWLLSLTATCDGSASQLLVLDASDVAAPPVAVVDLPRRVPAGFHGSWIADPV